MCAGGCGSGSCGCSSVQVPTGRQGATGANNYQLWLDAGNSGTVQDFLDSLIGEQGDPGNAAQVLSGTGDPVSPPSPSDAYALYIDDTPGNYWVWDTIAWTDTGVPAQGIQGNAGDDGANAFTTITAPFNQPAVGANVFIADSTGGFLWMVPGQNIFIEDGGYYEVVSVFNGGGGPGTAASVTNLGYEADGFGFAGNAAPGASIPSGSRVSPAGVIGPAGEDSTVPGPVGPVPNVDINSAFDNTAPANGAGIQFVTAGADAGNLYIYPEGGPWSAGYDLNGTDGTAISSGPELPNSLAPNVGAIGDYRFYVPAGVVESLWTKIDNTPTWSLVGLISSTSTSADQTFTALKTAAQGLPAANVNTTVLFENDSTGAGRDPANVWNGSVCTFIADAPTLRVTVEGLSLRRDTGTQVVTFTAHIYHRPLSTGTDVSIGSATFVYTGAAETTLTAAVIASSDITPLLGDQLRVVIDPSTAPSDSFSVLTAARLYTQSV